jgi:hypothetical protein
MRQLLLALLMSSSATAAVASHLLHQVPPEVAEKISKDCEGQWPNSAFEEGRCADDAAFEWLRTSGKTDVQPTAPGSVVTIPGLLDRSEDQPKKR